MKTNITKICIVLLLSIFSIIFVYNDDFLYSNKIMKITEITTKSTDEYQNYIGFKEKHYERIIKGTITNGKDKGKEIIVNYEETSSSVVTDKYKVSDKVFIENNEISGLKRDFYIAILVVIFIDLIYIVGNYKGLLSILSVTLNFVIFYIGLELYFKGINILFICIIESIIFAILSLAISNGLNKKTKSAIASVITSFIILLVGTLIITKITNYNGINFNEIKFLTVPPEDIVLPELLLGSIGAIMDVAITMSSSISELIEKDKDISVKNLKKSSKQIGKDIMSTMSNVLFFTYLCAGLPIYVLAARNGYSLFNFVSTNFSLELTRFLIGSIGIIMTIPISTMIAIKFFKRGEVDE